MNIHHLFLGQFYLRVAGVEKKTKKSGLKAVEF
jgi:hypothetical protein